MTCPLKTKQPEEFQAVSLDTADGARISGAPNTAVLLIVFNRPQTTARVFSAIHQARPPRLYIAADGPRQDRDEDRRNTAEVRELVSQVDWPCKVNTLFREQNRGCKYGVSEAISWFFQQEERGIILEDDTLPEPRFFPFLDQALLKHQDNPQIGAVCGYNMLGKRTHKRPFLSTYPHIWGWGTWRRVWCEYEVDPVSTEAEFAAIIERQLKHKAAAKGMARTGRQLREGKFNSWDFQLGFLLCRLQLLSLYPPINLISNIGFGPEATHTLSGHSAPLFPNENCDWEIDEPQMDPEYDRQRLTMEFPGIAAKIRRKTMGELSKLLSKIRD